VLLILPRCAKPAGCGVDVRGDLAVCATCDRCPLGEVALPSELSIWKNFDLHLSPTIPLNGFG
jgi:hypothetical protein